MPRQTHIHNLITELENALEFTYDTVYIDLPYTHRLILNDIHRLVDTLGDYGQPYVDIVDPLLSNDVHDEMYQDEVRPHLYALVAKHDKLDIVVRALKKNIDSKRGHLMRELIGLNPAALQNAHGWTKVDLSDLRAMVEYQHVRRAKKPRYE